MTTLTVIMSAVICFGALLLLSLGEYQRKTYNQVGWSHLARLIAALAFLAIIFTLIAIFILLPTAPTAASQPQVARSISTVITKSGSHP